MAQEAASMTATLDPTTSWVVARPLWQLPIFLLGVGALLAVTIGRDLWNVDPASRYRRDMAQLRNYLDKGGADSDEAIALTKRIRERVENYPESENVVHFLLGSAYLAQAEALSDEEGRELYALAQTHLEKAESLSVADADKVRLMFRLGRVWEQQDAAEPQKVIEYLARALQAGEDPSEGYRRLAEAYLRMPTPDLKRAREALQQQLSRALTRTPPRVLAQARLKLGELLTRMNDHEEARKVLDRIGPDAPAEIYVASRIALARSYQAENEFPQAIKHLEQAQSIKTASPSVRGPVLYHLGVCYAQSGRRSEAASAWAQAQQGADPEAQAACLKRAELLLRDGDRNGAVKALETSVARVKAGTPYQNMLIPANEARGLFEETCQTCRQAGDYDGAFKIADLYGRISEPGRDRELVAEITEGWGQTLLSSADADPALSERLKQEAKSKFLQAAQSYQSIAMTRKTSAEKGEMFRKASMQYRKAGDRQKALEMLDAIGLKIPDYPEDKLGDVYFDVGESHLAAGDKTQAKLAYQTSLRYPGMSQGRSRLQLAKLMLEENLSEQAVPLLKENLDPAIQARDVETHQQSLFALAESQYQLRNFPEAEKHLTLALQYYPSSPNATKGRFLLGRCYWYQAASESRELQKNQQEMAGMLTDAQKRSLQSQMTLHEKRYRELLKKAIVPFEEVVKALLPLQSPGKLSPLEVVLLRQSLFAISDAMFFLGDYEQAVQQYEQIALRYPGRVEALTAWSQAWSIYQNNLTQPEKASTALTQMRESSVQMKEDAFDGTTRIHRKDYWQNWFAQLDGTQR